MLLTFYWHFILYDNTRKGSLEEDIIPLGFSSLEDSSSNAYKGPANNAHKWNGPDVRQ